MKHIKRRTKILASILMTAIVILTLIVFFPAASAEPTDNDIEIFSSEAVVLDTDHYGDIEKVRVVTFFGLTGDGSVDVYKEKTVEGDSKWQGVHGFTTPVVEGDYLVWKGLDVDGFRNVMSSTEIKGEEMVEEISLRIPLDLQYRYYLDGEEVDPEDITGKDGHFRLELTMTNTSAEMTTLEHEDPATGEMKTKEVETYIPLAILPYDWYFDNNVFFNLEADPTGIVVPLPDHYQIGWSIPLFPPATEAGNTIWVEADVKDFRLPTLVLSANFVFPQTNQRDTLPEFIFGLETLYDGVKQLNDGLTQAVQGLGSAGNPDTLLYGTNAVLGGLEQMAEGLPEAQAALNTQLIPGVDQAVAGIGDPGAEQTLQWAVNESSKGLMQMLGGIGGPAMENTLLFAMTAMSGGLQEMSSGIGSPTTPNTLLFAADQATIGLEVINAGIGSASMQDTLLYAMSQMGIGLEVINAGIGSPRSEDTLLYAMAEITKGLNKAKAGIGAPDIDQTMLFGITAMIDGLSQMLAGIGSETTPDTLLYGIDQVSKGMSSGSTSAPGLLEGIQEIRGGLGDIYGATSTTGQIWQATNLIRILAPWTGPIVDQLEQGIILSTDPDNPSIHYGVGLMADGADQMIEGIGSPDIEGTLLYGTNEIEKGLNEIKEGIGGSEKLLYAAIQIKGGLEELRDGIGDINTNPSLLFAVNEVEKGLNDILGGIGSPKTNPSLLYAVAQVESGLELMKTGIGAANTGDTLLYALSAMTGGLNEMKAGIGTETTANTLMYAAAQVENGLDVMKAGMGAEGAPDTLLFAMASVQNGLQKLKTGLASGNPNDPGIKEGMMMISAGLGEAVSGLGSTSTPDTLLYGADQVNSGVEELQAGMVQASEGTGLMYAGLTESLAELYLTESELEAIKIRGEEFNHIMGSTEDAENSLAFIYQAPPTYNYKQGSKSSWMVAGIISVVIVIALLLASLLLRRRPVMG